MKNQFAFDAHVGVCYTPKNVNTATESDSFTYRDFIELTSGDPNMAEQVFANCSGQHPAEVLETLETLPPVAAKLYLQMAGLKNQLLDEILTILQKQTQPLLLYPPDLMDGIQLGATYSDDSILDFVICLTIVRNDTGVVTGATINTKFGNELSLSALQIDDLYKLYNYIPNAYTDELEVSNAQQVFNTASSTGEALVELVSQKEYMETNSRSSDLRISGNQLSGSYIDNAGQYHTVFIEIRPSQEVWEEPNFSYCDA